MMIVILLISPIDWMDHLLSVPIIVSLRFGLSELVTRLVKRTFFKNDYHG